MPSPTTPTRTKRTIRIPDPIWEQARAEANRLGMSTTAYISQLVAREVEHAGMAYYDIVWEAPGWEAP